jgi:hypothetical protein
LSDKHPLRTFILGTAIGGLILAFVLWFVPAVWQACRSASIWLFLFLLSSVSVPIWLIVLISPLIISTLVRMFSALREKDIGHPDWRYYNQDEIMGMHWRWRYSPYNADIEGIWSFCPDDDTELVYLKGYSQVSFRCETCKKQFGPFEGDLAYMLEMVKRQIRRKLRTGDWKAIVERLKLQ